MDQLAGFQKELVDTHLRALKDARAAFLVEIQTEDSASQPAKSNADSQKAQLEILRQKVAENPETATEELEIRLLITKRLGSAIE